MNSLDNQEKQPTILTLRSLLHSTPVATKSDQEWQVLENTTISLLEDEKKQIIQTRHRFFPIPTLRFFSGAVPALGVAACLILIGAGAGLFYASRVATKPLAESRILGSRGKVTYYPPKTTKKNAHPSSRAVLFNQQRFETGSDALCLVKIDGESDFMLSENTILTVQKADSRKIELFLEQGSILASIGTRAKNQRFCVLTPQARCTVIGTIFSVAVEKNHEGKNVTNLTVMEGTVTIADAHNPAMKENIRSGQTISFQNNALSEPQPASERQMAGHEISLLRLALQMSAQDETVTGLLDIRSTPSGAAIYLQNTLIGATPLVVRYPAGACEVKLSLPGYDLWRDTITVTGTQWSFLLPNLSPCSALLADARETPEVSAEKQRTAQKSERYNAHKTKDFGFIMDPAFVEALIQMGIGEYQKALIILDSLKELPQISTTEKIRIMNKIAECYKSMGNFQITLANLSHRHEKTVDEREKSNLLWEIINVQANCLQDYEGAEKDIGAYIKLYPHGAWIESAYAKLGEIQYLTGKYSKAIATFRYHIELFNTGTQVETSIYTLANILRLDVKEFDAALLWYSKLLKEYPSSRYFGNALFERAECYEKLGRHGKAVNDYKKYLTLFPEGHLKTFCLSRLSSQ